MSTVGSRIRDARIAKGLSQEALAKALDTSKATISRYESGSREPRFDVLRLLADKLEVTIGYLQGYESMNTYAVMEALKQNDIREFERLLGLKDGSIIDMGPDVDLSSEDKEFASDTLTEEQIEAAKIIKRIISNIQKGGPFKKLSDSEAHKAGFIQFHSEADRLTYFYSLLNDEGKRIAADRVQELSEVPKYGKHWGKEITDKITCPMSQINEYTAKGYEVSSIQYFENGTGEGTATMVKVAPSDALQSSDTTAPENPPESAQEDT